MHSFAVTGNTLTSAHLEGTGPAGDINMGILPRFLVLGKKKAILEDTIDEQETIDTLEQEYGENCAAWVETVKLALDDALNIQKVYKRVKNAGELDVYLGQDHCNIGVWLDSPTVTVFPINSGTSPEDYGRLKDNLGEFESQAITTANPNNGHAGSTGS